ncbi:enolase-phosphatase E1-like isoform X2 [Anneissia japonica]|uniref:enolase-phosphatase E1-like isoform X2 n=1 Tax=Anneissia japonica TaxID=1529436 RepID=UPI001425B940|nr:enolase-phosphatase E1-like isoform X2 [Anneissia japonica]
MSALDPKYYDALKEYRSEIIKCIDVNDILGEMTTLMPKDEERIKAELDVRRGTTQSACMELLEHIRRRGKECFFDFLLALQMNKCMGVLNQIIDRASCRDDWEKYCETKLSRKGEVSQTCKEEAAVVAEPNSIDVKKKKQEPVSKHRPFTKGRITGEIIAKQVTESTITTRPQVEPPQVVPPQVVQPQVMTNAATQPDLGGCQSISLCDVEWGILIKQVQKVEWLQLAKKFSFTGREMKEIRKSENQEDRFVEILIDKADEKVWTLETLQSHIRDIKKEPIKQSIQAVDEKSMQGLPTYEDVVGNNSSESPVSFITEASKGRPTIGMNISKETSELPVIDKSHIQKKSKDVDGNLDFQGKNLNSLSGADIKDNDKKNVNSAEPNKKQTITGTICKNSAGLIEKTEIRSNTEDMEQRLEPVASVDFYDVGAEGLKAENAAENLNPEVTTASGELPSVQASAIAEKLTPEPVASVDEPVASVDFYEGTGEAGDKFNAAENVGEVGAVHTRGEELHAGVQVTATVETYEPEPVASVDFYEGTSEGLKAGAELEAAENSNVGEQKISNKDINTGGKELHSGATVKTWEPEPEPETLATLGYEDTGEGLKAGPELEAAENQNIRETHFSYQELNTVGEELSAILQGTTIAETLKLEQASLNVNEPKFPDQEVNTAGGKLHAGIKSNANVKTWEPEPESVATLGYEDTGEGLKAGEELEAAENLNLLKHKGGEDLNGGVQASASLDSWELDPSELTELLEAGSSH